MIFCSFSSREGSLPLGRTIGILGGPAAAAFLRGVPGVAGSAVLTASLREAARLRGGEAEEGGSGGFLAMVLNSRSSCGPIQPTGGRARRHRTTCGADGGGGGGVLRRRQEHPGRR